MTFGVVELRSSGTPLVSALGGRLTLEQTSCSRYASVTAATNIAMLIDLRALPLPRAVLH